MLRMWIFSASVFLLLSVDIAFASRPTPARLEGLIRTSTSISHSRIEVATSSGHTNNTCQSAEIYYEAETIKNIRGTSQQKITFCTNKQLLIAGEYLLFLGAIPIKV